MKKLFIFCAIFIIAISGFSQNVFIVTKTSDPNPFYNPYSNIDSLCDPLMYGTLQWAIRKANDADSLSRIEFNIPGIGTHEIVLQSYLPQIVRPVEIDATTQPGYHSNSSVIKINGQNKFSSCFNVNKASVDISGFEMIGFKTYVIWLNYSSKSSIKNNKIILNYANNEDFKYAIGLAYSNNVIIKGNIILNTQISDSISPYCGMYIQSSNNVIIGDTSEIDVNLITNFTIGILLAKSQEVKISGNQIYDNTIAIKLTDASNNNISPPEILFYDNITNTLFGKALPNSVIEVFESTGPENANQYLTNTLADENGLFEVECNTEYDYFAATQRDLMSNTSNLSWLKKEKNCESPSVAVDGHVSVDSIEWYIEGNPGGFPALHITLCDNYPAFYIYDSEYFSNNQSLVFWSGECVEWNYNDWTGLYTGHCLYWDEENEIEPFWHDEYGPTILFDPAEYGVGEHIINLQYEICHTTRLYITILEAPDATITPISPICVNANNINLVAAEPNGVWAGNGIVDVINGIFDPSVAGVGTHQIIYTIHDEYCPASDTISIEVLPIPDITANNNGPVCEGQDVDFESSGSSNIQNYSWSGTSSFSSTSQEFTRFNVSLSMAGIYSVTVTDENGCTNQAETNLQVNPKPNISFNPHTPIICNLEPVEVCVVGDWEQILWNTNDTLPCIIASDVNETYTVTVTDQNGCTASDSVTTIGSYITMKDPVITNTCEGDNSGSISLYIGSTSPYTVQWSGPDGYSSNQQNISNLYAGTYTVTITDIYGCQIIEEFEVEAGATPLLETTANYVCNGAATGEASVLILNDIGEEYTIIWSNGDTTANIYGQLPETYFVTVTDEYGCSAEASANIENYIVNAAFSFNSDCIDLDQIGVPWYFNLHFNFEYAAIDWENYDFYWDLGNGTTSTEMTVPIDYTLDGYYCVSTVVSREECISTSSDYVYVNPNRCFCLESTFSSGFYNDYIVDSLGEIWSNDSLRIKEKIIVPSGATLELLGCELYFGALGGIIVEQGATLIVSKTKMTSLNLGLRCNAMWQGIEVHGKLGLPDEEQGKVYFIGGDTIENAHIGVLLGKRTYDYICNPNINPELSPFDTKRSCGWLKAENVMFVNNGTDIRFVKPFGNEHYQNPSSVTFCDFNCTELLDECYNSTHPSHYGFTSPTWIFNNILNTRNPWAGGSNIMQRSPQSIWMQQHTFNASFELHNFHHKEICFQTYDSKYNVIKCNFESATYGILVQNTLNSANYAHKFYQNIFKKIPNGACIYIRGGILDRIRDNKFGDQYDDSNIGIHTSGASRFVIEENDFFRFKIGVYIENSGDQASDVRAGLSDVYDNWIGNNFQWCNTNIFTRGNNEKLRLRCNNCLNDYSSLHFVNFNNEGVLANQGYFSLNSLPQQTWGAGNEFTDGNDNNPSPEARYIKSNYTYRYVHHSDVKTTPVEYNGTVLNLQPLGLAKADNSVACKVSLSPIILEPIPFPYFPTLDSILPISPVILNELDSLNQVYLNLISNLDGGKTQQLLNDIANRIPNGQLKNKLIANSPLSDTVITELLIEYPLSHGNFKNIMEKNMPVSPSVEPYLYARLETLPKGIRQQLAPLQSFNSTIHTPTSILRQFDYKSQERELLVNDIISSFTDTAYYNPEYIKQIMSAENNIKFEKNLAAFLMFEGNLIDAAQIINNIEPTDIETSDWVEYHQILLSLFEEDKSVNQMDSIQKETMLNLAYRCPMNYTTANAQAVLHLLYGIEFDECFEINTRRTYNLVKDVEFTLPDTDAWMEDNFPNPASNETLINYYLPNESTGSIVISDVYGRTKVEYQLVNGENTLVVNTTGWISGIYFYSLVVDGKSCQHNKMMISQ